MTDEEIHNIYLHMSGKAEGIAEVAGKADFPVLFARAILEHNRMEREWVGLTEEEIQSVHDTYHKRMGPQEFARAIEAKLKEKNTHD